MKALGSVFAKTLYEARRSVVGWGLEFVGVVVLVVAIYPSFAHTKALAKLGKSFPPKLTAFIGYGGRVDYASPVGFLGTELFTVMLPLLMLALAIAAGARSVASEEEQTTLDLLLSNPVSRRRVVLGKAAALLAELVLLAFVLFAALAVSTRLWHVAIPVARLAAASSFVLVLACLFGALALAVSAGTGRHDLAVGIPAGIAAISYLVNGVAPLVASLRGVARATPFYHYTTPAPLLHGFSVGHALALVVPALVLVALAVVAFDRRDVA